MKPNLGEGASLNLNNSKKILKTGHGKPEIGEKRNDPSLRVLMRGTGEAINQGNAVAKAPGS